MEYLVGLLLALAVAGLAAVVGFDRERAFYSTVLIVVASYYILFALMGASSGMVMVEVLAASVFLLFAILGYRKNVWLLAAALVGHGVFDFVHHLLIHNPGVPQWWPGFCLAFDAMFGVLLAARLFRHPKWASLAD
jgi:hypothetical protein